MAAVGELPVISDLVVKLEYSDIVVSVLRKPGTKHVPVQSESLKRNEQSDR